jgi:hypothetical protein
VKARTRIPTIAGGACRRLHVTVRSRVSCSGCWRVLASGWSEWWLGPGHWSLSVTQRSGRAYRRSRSGLRERRRFLGVSPLHKRPPSVLDLGAVTRGDERAMLRHDPAGLGLPEPSRPAWRRRIDGCLRAQFAKVVGAPRVRRVIAAVPVVSRIVTNAAWRSANLPAALARRTRARGLRRAGARAR